MDMGEEAIILNKEGPIDTTKVTRVLQYKYRIRIREDKVMKLQQLCIFVPNPDIFY